MLSKNISGRILFFSKYQKLNKHNILD